MPAINRVKPMLFHCSIAALPKLSPERRDGGLRLQGMKHTFDPIID
jgi:hypothetical protein